MFVGGNTKELGRNHHMRVEQGSIYTGSNVHVCVSVGEQRKHLVLTMDDFSAYTCL